MKKRAACYCRVSTKKGEQLESLDNQREFFERFLADHPDYELFRLYADEGISAKSLRNRRQFVRMLEDARARAFDVLFVKDVSRFARNAQDFFNSLETLDASGVRVHFVTMNLRTEEASRFTLGLMALLAEDESQRLSEKVKFGKNVTAKRGRVPNLVYGYTRIDAFTLVPHPEEAAWVRRIFEWYVREGWGAARIAERLNRSLVPTKRGLLGGWTQRVVSRMLKNELYAGRVVNRKTEVQNFKTGARRTYGPEDWVVVERPAFRIVDEDAFQAAQAISRDRNASAPGKGRPSIQHALSNLIACAADGYAFRRCTRTYARSGRVYVWWACSYRNAKGASSCDNRVKVDEGQMLRAIGAFLAHALPEENEAARRVQDMAAAEMRRRRGSLGERDALQREHRALSERRRRFLDAYAEAIIDVEELTSCLAPVQLRLREVHEALRLCDDPAPPDALASVRHAVRALEAGTDRALLGNAFLKTVFERFLVGEDGRITATLRLPGVAEMPFALVERG